jgi:hypothetical protein
MHIIHNGLWSHKLLKKPQILFIKKIDPCRLWMKNILIHVLGCERTSSMELFRTLTLELM